MSELTPIDLEEAHIVAEIAKFSGLEPREVSKVEVAILASGLGFAYADHFLSNPVLKAQALELLNKKQTAQYGQYLKRKYLPSLYHTDGRVNRDNYQRRVAEIEQHFLQLAEALLDLEIRFYSYGVFLPSYIEMLTKGKELGQIPHNSKTLLVGALTQETVSEYQQLMKRFFPEGQAITIDLEGINTPRQGPFAYADALRIPTSSGILDVIQTNILLHQLADNSRTTSRSSSATRIKLFEEFFRVLKPGGIITLVEGNLGVAYYGSNVYRAALLMLSELEATGFINISMEFATQFTNRRSVFRSRTRQEVKKEPVETSDGCLQIYAEKPRMKKGGYKKLFRKI